eukprot:403364900
MFKTNNGMPINRLIQTSFLFCWESSYVNCQYQLKGSELVVVQDVVFLHNDIIVASPISLDALQSNLRIVCLVIITNINVSQIGIVVHKKIYLQINI